MRKLIILILLSCVTFVYGQESANFKPYFSNNISFGFGVAVPNDDLFLGSQLEYVGLFHLSPKVAVGAGTGLYNLINFDFFLDNHEFSDSKLSTTYFIPLYAQARFRFLDRKVSPILNISLGYNISLGSNAQDLVSFEDNDYSNNKLKSGFMSNASAGVSVRFKNNMALQVSPFLHYFKTQEVVSIKKYERNDIFLTSLTNFQNVRAIDIFQFGLKVGFLF